MKNLIVSLLTFLCMNAFATYINGTGVAVNGKYIVSAYHVVEEYGNACYLDRKTNKCHPLEIVDFDVDADLVLLKVKDNDKKVFSSCSIMPTEINVGDKVTSFGYFKPEYNDYETRILHSKIKALDNVDGVDLFYRISTKLIPGMSGGPLYNSDGEVVGLSKSYSLVETKTSNVIKSTEIMSMLKRNGVKNMTSTNMIQRCTMIIVSSDVLPYVYYGY